MPVYGQAERGYSGGYGRLRRYGTIVTDLNQAMLAQRRVMISGPLDIGLVSTATAQLMYLDGVSDEPTNVIINSPGGRIDDALPLLDALRLLRTPAMVDVLGRAEGSAGVVVAAAPGQRRLGATASVSLRLERDTVHPGTAQDLERLAEAQRQRDQSIATAIAERTGQSVEWVFAEFRSGPSWRGAEAVGLGLVDEVR